MTFHEGRLAVAAERRMHRSWAEDGLMDVFLGVFFVVGSAFFLGTARVSWIAAFGLLAPAVAYLLGKALWTTKARVSDARVGYIRPRQWRPRRQTWVAIIIASLVVGAVDRPLLRIIDERADSVAPAFETWWPALLLGATGVVFFFGWMLGYSPGRHVWLALVAFVAAVAGPALGLRADDSLALGYAIIGAAMIVFGMLALRAFVRRHPPRVDG